MWVSENAQIDKQTCKNQIETTNANTCFYMGKM